MKTIYTYKNRKYKTVNILKIRKQAPKTQMCAQNTLKACTHHFNHLLKSLQMFEIFIYLYDWTKTDALPENGHEHKVPMGDLWQFFGQYSGMIHKALMMMIKPNRHINKMIPLF